ncbi:hypothetical protein P3342_011212 [Pyrenophora teres f. teres]|nr:hypothetical protein P3342_011212 [Pyrenophora teres f. teres]
MGWTIRTSSKPSGPAHGAAGTAVGDGLENAAPAEDVRASGEVYNLAGYVRHADARVDGAEREPADAAFVGIGGFDVGADMVANKLLARTGGGAGGAAGGRWHRQGG